VFSDVCQDLQRALYYENRAKECRNFPRNERHVNTVQCSSESSDDKEADMCVAEWSWGSKSKPFVCSSLKPVSKSREDEMHYTFDVAKCEVIPSLEQLKKACALQMA
jgi:hypothetical protein